MRENLKNITGLEFIICSVVIAIFVNTIISSSQNPTTILIVSVILSATLLYITYFRWVRLKLGNISFVFYNIAGLIVAMYGNVTYDELIETSQGNYGPLEGIFTALAPLLKLYIFIMFLILAFKNAKVKSKSLSDDKSIDTNKEVKLDDESQDNSSLSIEDAKKKLIVLKEYLDLGIITQDEFDEKAKPLKKILLDD